MSSSLCWVCEKTFTYDFPGACKQAGTFSGVHFLWHIFCGEFSGGAFSVVHFLEVHFLVYIFW